MSRMDNHGHEEDLEVLLVQEAQEGCEEHRKLLEFREKLVPRFRPVQPLSKSMTGQVGGSEEITERSPTLDSFWWCCKAAMLRKAWAAAPVGSSISRRASGREIPHAGVHLSALRSVQGPSECNSFAVVCRWNGLKMTKGHRRRRHLFPRWVTGDLRHQ